MTSLTQFIPAVRTQVYLFAASTTWSPPSNCKARVIVIGAGGGGAGTKSNGPDGSGGAGGGCAIKTLRLTTDVTYTITIGAGGSGGSETTATETTEGANGGNTSFAATGINTLWGFGGMGAKITPGNVTSGGTSSNGDFNFSGESVSLANTSYRGGLCGIFGSAANGSSKQSDSTTTQLGNIWDGCEFGVGMGQAASSTQSAAGGTGAKGCGGGYATCTSSGASATGGTGGNGLVIIEVMGQ